jgi:hypothetical protein
MRGWVYEWISACVCVWGGYFTGFVFCQFKKYIYRFFLLPFRLYCFEFWSVRTLKYKILVAWGNMGTVRDK